MIGGDLLFVRALRECYSIDGNRLCVRSLACACTHYFARYLRVMVKIRTLEIIFPVALAGSLVWWDSP